MSSARLPACWWPMPLRRRRLRLPFSMRQPCPGGPSPCASPNPLFYYPSSWRPWPLHRKRTSRRRSAMRRQLFERCASSSEQLGMIFCPLAAGGELHRGGVQRAQGVGAAQRAQRAARNPGRPRSGHNHCQGGWRMARVWLLACCASRILGQLTRSVACAGSHKQCKGMAGTLHPSSLV